MNGTLPRSVSAVEFDCESSDHFVRMYMFRIILNRMCEWSRGERMVAHDFTDPPLLRPLLRGAQDALRRKCADCVHLAVPKCCVSRQNPDEAMSHDGNVNQLVASREFFVGWRRRHACFFLGHGKGKSVSQRDSCAEDSRKPVILHHLCLRRDVVTAPRRLPTPPHGLGGVLTLTPHLRWTGQRGIVQAPQTSAAKTTRRALPPSPESSG